MNKGTPADLHDSAGVKSPLRGSSQLYATTGSTLKLPDFAHTSSGHVVLVDASLAAMRPERVKTIWNAVQAAAAGVPGCRVVMDLDFAADRLGVWWDTEEHRVSPRTPVQFQ